MEAVWRVHSDPATNAHNPAGPMRDRGEAVDLAHSSDADWMQNGVGYWAVELRSAPGGVVGLGGIRLTTWHDQRVYNLYYRPAPQPGVADMRVS